MVSGIDQVSSGKMAAQFPMLSQLGIYRVSGEKQETLIKLMVLSICAILGKVVSTLSASLYPLFL